MVQKNIRWNFNLIIEKKDVFKVKRFNFNLNIHDRENKIG